MPKRRVFISYQHSDQMQAKGFNLMRYNENVGVNFVGRHLLNPVDSTDSDYVTTKIKEQLEGSSATVVLVGKHTAESEWVEREIAWSAEKGNGIVAVRLDTNAVVPDSLTQLGAEVLEWSEVITELDNAVERAIQATKVGQNMPLNSQASCQRID